MPERVVPNRQEEAPQIREAVSVSTRKFFDGCRDKDCVDDLRVYPTLTSQPYIENALSIRFPVEEFFPPDSVQGTTEYRNMV